MLNKAFFLPLYFPFRSFWLWRSEEMENEKCLVIIGFRITQHYFDYAPAQHNICVMFQFS
jgi:hypothetical protein